MSDLSDLQSQAWARMPVVQRTQAVRRLQEIVSADNLQYLYTKRDDPYFHHSAGMTLRNLLRSNHGLEPKPKNAPILDNTLPDLSDLYGASDGEYRNWDDFYMQVLEAAAGHRSIGGLT